MSTFHILIVRIRMSRVYRIASIPKQPILYRMPRNDFGSKNDSICRSSTKIARGHAVMIRLLCQWAVSIYAGHVNSYILGMNYRHDAPGRIDFLDAFIS